MSVLLNAALMTMQIVIGWLAYSDGLLADGVHTLADLAADGMVLAVLRLSLSIDPPARPPGNKFALHSLHW